MLKGNVVAVTGVNSGIVKERKRGDNRVASVSAGQNLLGRARRRRSTHGKEQHTGSANCSRAILQNLAAMLLPVLVT